VVQRQELTRETELQGPSVHERAYVHAIVFGQPPLRLSNAASDLPKSEPSFAAPPSAAYACQAPSMGGAPANRQPWPRASDSAPPHPSQVISDDPAAFFRSRACTRLLQPDRPSHSRLPHAATRVIIHRDAG